MHPWHEAARNWAPRLIVMLGAAATIATSKADDPSILAQADDFVVAGDVVGIDVVLNESAARQLRAFAAYTTLEVTVSGARLVAPLGAEEGPGSLIVRPECPDEGPCVARFDAEVPADGAIYVQAVLEVTADSSFPFPQSRAFPADATMEIVLER